MHRPFTLTERLRSFRWAFRGIGLMLASQHNAWIHAVATLLVVAVAAWLRLAAWEWCAVVAAIVGVWTAEALNTALEFLADVASPEFHPLVEKAKDVAAGGVLIAALGATTIAALVLWPHLIARLGL